VTAPTKVLVFQNRFRLGGQERQTVLHVRTVARTKWDPIVACLHRDGEHLADLAAAGITPRVFDVGHRMIRPNTAVQVAKIVRFIRAEGIRIVHAQDLYTNVLGTLAARAAGVPAIVTRVDLAHNVVGYRRPLLRWASQNAERVLVNAMVIRDLAIRDGVEPDRIVVVRNGVDLDELDRAARRAPDPPAPAPGGIVCVANMHHPVKGQTDLLVAMKEVLRQVPHARAVFVGDGVRRPLMEGQARQLGIHDRCHFLGHRLDGPAIVARAAIGVSASYAEGISNAILEYMGLRLPVVSTAVGGSPELVREGENGFLVPPGSPAALARRILDLLRDPALRKTMGEKGREIVATEFDVEQMRVSYDALYQELTGLRIPRIMYGAA
jgi:glycosyltransferase involved in cell wall biosynthesis